MQIGTAVQLRAGARLGTVLCVVASDPSDFESDESTERIGLDVGESDAALLGRFAAYRNALASAQGKKLRKKWTRKSIAESMLAAQCVGLRAQLKDMLEAVGDLPDPSDEPGLVAYAKRVLKWSAKHNPE